VKEGFVADASIAISWTVPSQSTMATDRLLDRVASGNRFVVPALWMLEVANTLLVLVRRRLLSDEESAQARRKINELTPVLDEEGMRLAFGRVYDLATEHALSVYDAAYLELALRTQLPLASRDLALNKAAKRAGVRLAL
jgi:predicted nucleic acid-binding protein